jgi:siroheme synthase-like protein
MQKGEGKIANMKKGNQLHAYYPIFLHIRDRRCVVVGGGQVALRKVKTLLDHGATVDVISSELCPELIELAENGQICIFRRHYQPGDLRGAFITIAATDNSEVNQAVVKEAQKEGILINVVDDASSSDFIVPSYTRRGDVTIAISTAGKSPALARKIRTRVEREFGEEYASLALLIDEVRTELRQRRIKVNSDTWQEALDLDLLIDLVKKGDNEKVKAVLLTNLKSDKGTVKAGFDAL